MPLFYNNESTSLEKRVDIQPRDSELNIEYQFETSTCIQWINENGFKKVFALLLPHAFIFQQL